MLPLQLDLPTVIAVLAIFALLQDLVSTYYVSGISTATAVSSGILKPRNAVYFAVVFNLLAIFFFQSNTVASGIALKTLDLGIIDYNVILGALLGSFGWSIIAGQFFISSSPIHTLISALVGSAVAKGGLAVLSSGLGFWKMLLMVFVAPLAGLVLSALLLYAISHALSHRPAKTTQRKMRYLQLASLSLFNLGFATQQAQKTIAILWLLLLVTQSLEPSDTFPIWLSAICYANISLGILLSSKYTMLPMNRRISKLRPLGGVSAETGSFFVLLLCTVFGYPASPAHTLAGSLTGISFLQNFSSVCVRTIANVVISWFIAIPMSACMGAAAWWISEKLLA